MRAKYQPNFWKLVRKLENYLELTKHDQHTHISKKNRQQNHSAACWEKLRARYLCVRNAAISSSLRSFTALPCFFAYLVSATKSIAIDGLLSYGLNIERHWSTVVRFFEVLHFIVSPLINIHLHDFMRYDFLHDEMERAVWMSCPKRIDAFSPETEKLNFWLIYWFFIVASLSQFLMSNYMIRMRFRYHMWSHKYSFTFLFVFVSAHSGIIYSRYLRKYFAPQSSIDHHFLQILSRYHHIQPWVDSFHANQSYVSIIPLGKWCVKRKCSALQLSYLLP